VIANPFSFSGFSDKLFSEIDLDDIDVGKTTGTDYIDDNAFFEDFAIDSDGEAEEASGVAAPAAASSLTASPPLPVQSTQSSPQQQQQKQQQYVKVGHRWRSRHVILRSQQQQQLPAADRRTLVLTIDRVMVVLAP